MPHESRQILFQMQELQSAIRAHVGHTKAELPPGEIVAVRFPSEASAFVEFDLRDETTGQTDTVSYDEASVGAALLKYCMQHRIPVPRKSDKSLRLINGCVALMIAIKPLGPVSL
jgi:hypothetical protein